MAQEGIRSKLAELAKSISDSVFGNSSLNIASNKIENDIDVQEELLKSSVDSLAEIRLIYSQLTSRYPEDLEIAKRLMAAHTSLKLISYLYFERRNNPVERRKDERRKVQREEF